jgi:NAD(P)-dependent dehydrogenase (short-subunit alcohol dehydrogenase family)
LVTGSRRGIGLGIARSLAREGYNLVVNGVGGLDSATEQVKALEALGAEVLYVPADVSRPEDRRRLLEETRRRFGGLQVLVNNAGVAPLVRADILEATEESFERVMRINLQGPYFLTQAAARWMIEQKRAEPPAGPAGGYCIINVSSISSRMASVNRGEYCVSKAGVSMAARLWAVRLAEHGIPVYEIQPGIIKTDMTAAVTEKYDRLIAEGLVPQKRWGFPEDVGRAAAMLARGDLPYSTGQVIRVEGGQLIPRL